MVDVDLVLQVLLIVSALVAAALGFTVVGTIWRVWRSTKARPDLSAVALWLIACGAVWFGAQQRTDMLVIAFVDLAIAWYATFRAMRALVRI